MTGAKGAWGVTLLVREPAALVLANIAWHRAQGADVIHLYLDDPDDQVAALLAPLPGLRVTRCDAEFWHRLNAGRPALQTQRQTLTATHAYRQRLTEWLVHLDADEFLFSRKPLSAELAAIPAHKNRLRFLVRERVFTRSDPQDLFEGLYLIPQPDEVTPMTREGLVGHAAGKQATRRGLDVALRPHGPYTPSGPVKGHASTSTVLLHLDGLTPLHWLLKLLRYADHPPQEWERFLGPHRQAQVSEALAHRSNPGALNALHDRLKLHPSPVSGRIEALPFDPGPALSALGLQIDRSVQGFDAMLRQECPDLTRGL